MLIFELISVRQRWAVGTVSDSVTGTCVTDSADSRDSALSQQSTRVQKSTVEIYL